MALQFEKDSSDGVFLLGKGGKEMAVKGSATVTKTKKGNLTIIKWDYILDAAGKLEDVGTVTNVSGIVLGLKFVPAQPTPVADTYDLLVLGIGEGDGYEWDICMALALNMPGAGNSAGFWCCPLVTTNVTNQGKPIYLRDETITLQSGTVIGTSTDIGGSAVAYGTVYMYLDDLPETHWR